MKNICVIIEGLPKGSDVIAQSARQKFMELGEFDKRFELCSSGIAIRDVIFNPPATIVFWSDGVKTVVKAQNGEPFDPEKGLAMAISKRVMGNTGRYFQEFIKWCKYGEPESDKSNKVSADEKADGNFITKVTDSTPFERILITLGKALRDNEERNKNGVRL